MTRDPVMAAPMHMPMEAISSSPWMPMPPRAGRFCSIIINIEEAGVIG